MDANAIVQSFHPKLQPYIREVLCSGNVGICAGSLKIDDVQSGRPTIEESDCGDRFKLIIPYAEVGIIEENVPSLANWDSQDSKSLLYVICELLALYRKHQVSLLSDYSRLQFEYSSLVYQTPVCEDDVEVLIGSRGTNIKSRLMGGAVNFLIRLKIDFSDLPPVPTGEDSGECAAVLVVTFHPPEGSRIIPQLFLSPRVEKALGGSSSFHLPPFPSGSCLMDYVPVVAEQLRDRVSAMCVTYEKKKEYLGAFCYRMGKAMLEFDAISFSRASFLLECRDFYFLLHVSLPMHFPKERPVFVLQSVYHSSYGKPFKSRYDDYPYSPRWDPSEMVERACTCITSYVEVFQRNSIQSCPI
ncbi:BRCA1-A complex subunit BRE [Cryptotermes secundus]|uniref:BRISC and BRCA1-A complex member 2 n=1 Tax=Cryptotermes secundus TaxID=105785 RepID=A0A2J7QRF3_9NEOP|nr:BRISC and BRCA1-A complex member 2 isoform X3 [Cryptotermes secundus]PNF31169.1 BRCA1-A complex subunit BRE [Cryptotermes secundus]